MKTHLYVLLWAILCLCSPTSAQDVAGDFELDRGIIIPSITTVERNSITAPMVGHLVNHDGTLEKWAGPVLQWVPLGAGGTSLSALTIDSDAILHLAGADGTTSYRVNPAAFRTLLGTGAPVDGTTIAWFVDQEFVNATTGTRYRATAASADPDAAGTGSVWVALAGAGGAPLIDSPIFDGATGSNVNSATSSKRYIDGVLPQIGFAPPVSGTTTAWRVGAEFIDSITGLRYRASIASTQPHLSPVGSVWQQLPQPGSSPITTRGDLVRGSAIGVEERLALGTTGQVLTTDGTDLIWGSNPPANDFATFTHAGGLLTLDAGPAQNFNGSFISDMTLGLPANLEQGQTIFLGLLNTSVNTLNIAFAAEMTDLGGTSLIPRLVRPGDMLSFGAAYVGTELRCVLSDTIGNFQPTHATEINTTGVQLLSTRDLPSAGNGFFVEMDPTDGNLIVESPDVSDSRLLSNVGAFPVTIRKVGGVDQVVQPGETWVQYIFAGSPAVYWRVSAPTRPAPYAWQSTVGGFVNLDALYTDHFIVDAGSSITLNLPSNLQPGQKIQTIIYNKSIGDITVTFDPSWVGFATGVSVPPRTIEVGQGLSVVGFVDGAVLRAVLPNIAGSLGDQLSLFPAANMAWDASVYQNVSIDLSLLDGQLELPNNPRNGQTHHLFLYNSGGIARTLTWATGYQDTSSVAMAGLVINPGAFFSFKLSRLGTLDEYIVTRVGGGSTGTTFDDFASVFPYEIGNFVLAAEPHPEDPDFGAQRFLWRRTTNGTSNTTFSTTEADNNWERIGASDPTPVENVVDGSSPGPNWVAQWGRVNRLIGNGTLLTMTMPGGLQAGRSATIFNDSTQSWVFDPNVTNHRHYGSAAINTEPVVLAPGDRLDVSSVASGAIAYSLTVAASPPDAGAEWVAGGDYSGVNNVNLSFVVPLTGGPYITKDGVTLTAGRRITAQYDIDATAGPTLDTDEVLLMNFVGEQPPKDYNGTLERAFIGIIAGNKYAVPVDRYTWLENTGIDGATTLEMPIFASWDGFGNERRGLVPNGTGQDIGIVPPAVLGYTIFGLDPLDPESLPTTLDSGKLLEWRQTGPFHVQCWIVNDTFNVDVSPLNDVIIAPWLGSVASPQFTGSGDYEFILDAGFTANVAGATDLSYVFRNVTDSVIVDTQIRSQVSGGGGTAVNLLYLFNVTLNPSKVYEIQAVSNTNVAVIRQQLARGRARPSNSLVPSDDIGSALFTWTNQPASAGTPISIPAADYNSIAGLAYSGSNTWTVPQGARVNVIVALSDKADGSSVGASVDFLVTGPFGSRVLEIGDPNSASTFRPSSTTFEVDARATAQTFVVERTGGGGGNGNTSGYVQFTEIAVPVIPTTNVVIDDQSTLGYRDIGDTREQWGTFNSTVDTAEAFTFPQPFSGVPYDIQLTLESLNAGSAVALEEGTLAALGFSANRNDGIDNTDNPVIRWRAIGPK